MGAMAKGRTIRGIEDGFELRESQSVYNAVLDTENCNIAPQKARFKTGLHYNTNG